MIDNKQMELKSKAIRNLYPKAVTINRLDLELPEVLDKDQQPFEIDEGLFKEEYKKLQIGFEGLKYQRERKSEYPKIEDQLDLLYHKGVDGWKEEIQKVKDRYPKPEAPSE